MCLTTQSNLKPLIATKDLKVIKILKERFDGRYVTPCQEFPVELNSTLVATENSDPFGMKCHDNCRSEIGGGYIHAILNINDFRIDVYNIKVVDAYIPKGTEYYVDIYLSEICAKKMYVTDNVDGTFCPALSHEEIMDIIQPILDNIQTDTVSSGWVYTSDKRFVHPKDIQDTDDVIGVVVYRDENNHDVTVFSLDEYYSTWESANNICKEYTKTGDDLGKWTIPSIEILQDAFANSLIQINAVLFIVSHKMKNIVNYYWVFDEDDSYNRKCGDAYSAEVSKFNYIDEHQYVRFSLNIPLRLNNK